jgi:hypothetical protein
MCVSLSNTPNEQLKLKIIADTIWGEQQARYVY